MLCPFCKEEIKDGAIKCRHCDSMLYSNENFPLTSDLLEMECIEALKTTNTPCLLWVSLDYWNLYLSGERVLGIRCYRGKWGLISSIIGLFFAFVGFFITATIGILLDKHNGETKCSIMKIRLPAISNNLKQYKHLETAWNEVGGIDASDLCLGNFWLKYKVEIAGKSFYFENSKHDQIIRAFKKYHGSYPV